jgi:tRNA(Ile)-lysidine synthase
MPESGVETGVEAAVAAALAGAAGPVVLAVSGGADSMVLMHSVAAVAPHRVAAVATFDHATGAASRAGVELVERVARVYGFEVVSGVAPAPPTAAVRTRLEAGPVAATTAARTRLEAGPVAATTAARTRLEAGPVAATAAARTRLEAGPAAAAQAYGINMVPGTAPPTARSRHTEAEWRATRWAFLRRVAHERAASVATGHTRDDQIETVVIRALRGAGARGLAGLDVDSDVIRPLMGVDRSAVRAYARAHELDWIEDPSNASRAHLRNRVRLELLPAMRAVQPGFERAMLAVAARAAAWRRELEGLVTARCPVRRTADGLSVAVADLAQYDHHTVAVVWPVIAARAGVILDARGTSRLAAFTFNSKVGGTIQLSGGVEVVRSRFLFVIRPLW